MVLEENSNSPNDNVTISSITLRGTTGRTATVELSDSSSFFVFAEFLEAEGVCIGAPVGSDLYEELLY